MVQDGNSTEKAASGFALRREGNGATEGDGAAASNVNGAMAGDGGGAAAEPETPIGRNTGPRLTERKKVRRNKDKVPILQTGFMYFANLKRDSILTKHPGLSVPDLGRKQGELWRELKKEEQRSYKAQAAGQPLPKPRKQREKGSSLMSPYLLFCDEVRPQLMVDNPGITFKELGKRYGTMWNTLRAKGQAPFVAAYAQQKAAALLAAAASDTVLRAAGEVEEVMFAEPKPVPLPSPLLPLYVYEVPRQIVRYENEQARWPYMLYRPPSPPTAPPPPPE